MTGDNYQSIDSGDVFIRCSFFFIVCRRGRAHKTSLIDNKEIIIVNILKTY